MSDPMEKSTEEQRILLEKCDVLISQKMWGQAMTELVRALMQSARSKKDSADMVDLLWKLHEVMINNKEKELAEAVKNVTSELAKRIEVGNNSEEGKDGESHFFVEVLFVIAKGYFAKDDHEFGHIIMNFTIDTLTEIEGESAYLLGDFYTCVGEQYRHKNLFAEAITAHEKAVAIRREADSKTNNSEELTVSIKRALSDSLSCLGASHRAAMKYVDAEKCYEEALTIRREHLSHDGPIIGKSYNDIAELMRDKKDFDKAIRYHVAAIETFTRFFDPDHPRVVNAKGNHGVTLNHLSRHSFEKGSELVKKALAFLYDNKYPPDHVWVKKFRAELTIENAQHEIEDAKKRIKKLQSEQVLHEISMNLQEKRYAQLEDKIRDIERDRKNELNKVRFTNSVLSEQLAMNKKTTENLMSENDDILQKMEELITKQKLKDNQHEEEVKKLKEIFSELLSKTEDLEAKDVRFHQEEERLLDEIDGLNNREIERLNEIENVEAKNWDLQKKLKVVTYECSKLQEKLNSPKFGNLTIDFASQTEILCPDDQGYLEKLSKDIVEECINIAVEKNESFAERKKKRDVAKKIFIPNDSEEFVRHQYAIHEAEPHPKEDFSTSVNNKVIHDILISFKAEEVLSTMALSLLHEMKAESQVEMTANNNQYESEISYLRNKLLAVEDELTDIRYTSESYLEELSILRDFMKKHDLKPETDNLQKIKDDLKRLHVETKAQQNKIDELETNLQVLKVERDHATSENEGNKLAATELSDANHLLTLKLQAANFEIEHMSAELHDERQKTAELQSDLAKKCKETDMQASELFALDETYRSQLEAIESRDEKIENLENEILNLKGIPRRHSNQTSDFDVKVESSNNEGATEGREKEDSETCFLTGLDTQSGNEESRDDDYSPFLPALESSSKSPPKPDEKSTSEDSPTQNRVRFLEPIDSSGSSDFAEVLFLAPRKAPTSVAATKRAMHTKDRDRNMKRQRNFCTMCDSKIKGPPKVIPTSLQNVLKPGESFDNIHKSNDGSTKEFQMAGFPKSSKNYLDSQVIWRESYSTRAEDCIFCCWDCAREWNKKYSPVNYRYITQKLIDIAAGKFIS